MRKIKTVVAMTMLSTSVALALQAGQAPAISHYGCVLSQGCVVAAELERSDEVRSTYFG